MKDSELYELRCTSVGCDKLLAKCAVNSFIEVKCKACKHYSYFIQGTSISLEERSEQGLKYLQDIFFGNNNFKGG